MGDGKHCPVCRKDIGIWPIFSAGLPSRIWCPHCSARLQYRGALGVFLFLLVVMAGSLTAGYFASLAVPASEFAIRGIVFVGVLFGAWVPVELGVAWFLRNKRELVCINVPSSEPPSKSA